MSFTVDSPPALLCELTPPSGMRGLIMCTASVGPVAVRVTIAPVGVRNQLAASIAGGPPRSQLSNAQATGPTQQRIGPCLPSGPRLHLICLRG